MNYKEANENELDIICYDWESLVKEFTIETLIEVAKSAYGGRIQIDGDGNDKADLYDSLWWHHYLDNFTHPWYFKAHYYNKYKYEPDMDNVEVKTKSN